MTVSTPLECPWYTLLRRRSLIGLVLGNRWGFGTTRVSLCPLQRLSTTLDTGTLSPPGCPRHRHSLVSTVGDCQSSVGECHLPFSLFMRSERGGWKGKGRPRRVTGLSRPSGSRVLGSTVSISLEGRTRVSSRLLPSYLVSPVCPLPKWWSSLVIYQRTRVPFLSFTIEWSRGTPERGPLEYRRTRNGRPGTGGTGRDQPTMDTTWGTDVVRGGREGDQGESGI